LCVADNSRINILNLIVFVIKALIINSKFSLYIKLLSIKVEERDGTKSKAARQAGQRALQRLTSLSKAALSYIASSKRQRAQRSFRPGLRRSAFGGF
jgi:hypothetical protein